ncbi:hypothetical protein V6Z11_D08G241300 [Gossypium hirsutum]
MPCLSRRRSWPISLRSRQRRPQFSDSGEREVWRLWKRCTYAEDAAAVREAAVGHAAESCCFLG